MECFGNAKVYLLSTPWQCQFRVTHSRVTFYCARACCGFRKAPSEPFCARPKATGRMYSLLRKSPDCSGSLLHIAQFSGSPYAFQNRSRRLSYCQWKCQHLATFGWGKPLCNLAKALWYVELDYLCHMSSEAPLCLREQEEHAEYQECEDSDPLGVDVSEILASGDEPFGLRKEGLHCEHDAC